MAEELKSVNEVSDLDDEAILAEDIDDELASHPLDIQDIKFQHVLDRISDMDHRIDFLLKQIIGMKHPKDG